MAARYTEDPRAADHIVKMCGGMLDKILPEIEKDAKRYVPVLTGYLRNHIGHDKISPTHGRVYANAEYAAAIEKGFTHARSGQHIPAQPYLRPAAYKNRNPT